MRQRESEKTVLYLQGGGELSAEPEIPWRGLPSKYYHGPMLLNFSVRMGTGGSKIVNPLTTLLCLVFFIRWHAHRHLSNIDCQMVCTACLVCFISTVNGRNKNKIKEAKNALEYVALVAGT